MKVWLELILPLEDFSKFVEYSLAITFFVNKIGFCWPLHITRTRIQLNQKFKLLMRSLWIRALTDWAADAKSIIASSIDWLIRVKLTRTTGVLVLEKHTIYILRMEILKQSYELNSTSVAVGGASEKIIDNGVLEVTTMLKYLGQWKRSTCIWS